MWLAYDDQLDSPVAIKVLADNWSGDADVRRRFVEEGRYLRRVDSPHVVAVYDAGELDDGRPYLVMTYADQGTLADRMETGPLGAWQGVDVVRQIGLGLTALHRRDVLHRDVKPGNVLFRTDDSRPEGWLRAMLGDLGLGKSLDLSSRLTMIAGTPSYVAPEQARGDALDARADQFSLGAVTYLVLTGRPPQVHATLAGAAEGRPAPPLGTPERPFPPEVEAAVARALDPDRDRRWPDVAAYVAALDAAVAGVAAAGAPVSGSDERTLVFSALTAVGERPSPWPLSPPEREAEREPDGPATVVSEPADPTPVRSGASTGPRRRRWPLVVAGLLAVAVGAAVAYAVERPDGDGLDRVTSASGRLSVEVPHAWGTTVGTSDWTPPGSDRSFPALAVGGQGSAPGVFVGLLPAASAGSATGSAAGSGSVSAGAVVPGHPECTPDGADTTDRTADQVTVVHTRCPGGVVVEQVVRVVGHRWLWTQVRAPDLAQARQVLGSVRGPAPVSAS